MKSHTERLIRLALTAHSLASAPLRLASGARRQLWPHKWGCSQASGVLLSSFSTSPHDPPVFRCEPWPSMVWDPSPAATPPALPGNAALAAENPSTSLRATLAVPAANIPKTMSIGPNQ